jgi:hypothetical protein
MKGCAVSGSKVKTGPWRPNSILSGEKPGWSTQLGNKQPLEEPGINALLGEYESEVQDINKKRKSTNERLLNRDERGICKVK